MEDKSLARPTTLMLQRLQRDATDTLARDVADFILKHWALPTINTSNKVGFWWHRNGGVETNVINVHAFSNAISRPDGPWPLELKYDSYHIFDGIATKREFLRFGFACIEENLSGRDCALAFENPYPEK